MSLPPEIRFLLRWCLPSDARPEDVPPAEQDLRWPVLISLATANRVAPLLYHHLSTRPEAPTLPPEVSHSLRQAYLRNLGRVSRMARDTAPALEALRSAGLPALVLRGPALGARAYGDPALRPFTDLDLLVRRHDLERAKSVLVHAGYQPLAHTLSVRYFETYHLHIPFTRAGGGTVIELHWALDHRYVTFAIPYEDIFQRARHLEAADWRLQVPAPPDDLVCNIVHAAKHAYYLPFIWDHPDLPERVVHGRDLLLLCDIAAEIRRGGAELDWRRLAEKGRTWGVEREIGAVLGATARLLGTPSSAIARECFGAPRVSRLEHLAFRCLAGGGAGGVAGRLTKLNARALFRPVRALDLIRYAFPGRRFIQRRYGCRGPLATALWRSVHPCVAVGELVRHAWAWWRSGWPELFTKT